MSEPSEAKIDERPARAGWAPGNYWVRACAKCDAAFIGDKRAFVCADCAYAEPDKPSVPDPTIPDTLTARSDVAEPEALRILRLSYTALAFAFRRLHESPRSRDGELCLDFQKVRAEIEKHFKDQGVKL